MRWTWQRTRPLIAVAMALALLGTALAPAAAAHVVATDDRATTEVATPVVIDVLDNDSAGATVIAIRSEPEHGVATINGDGTITYAPDDDFRGLDSFAYAIEGDGEHIGTAEVHIAVGPHADLQLQKTVSDTSPDPGDTISYTLTLTNLGEDDATNVEVEDRLPAAVAWLGASVSDGTYDEETGLWDVGDLASGASATLTLNVEVDPEAARGDRIKNTAQASADQLDPNPRDNEAAATIVIGDVADLGVRKAASAETAEPGEQVTYTITVTNHGPEPATGVEVHDDLPAGLTLVSTTATQGTYDETLGVWAVGDLANGASATLTVTVEVTTDAELTNVATVAGDQIDPARTNDRAEATINDDGREVDLDDCQGARHPAFGVLCRLLQSGSIPAEARPALERVLDKHADKVAFGWWKNHGEGFCEEYPEHRVCDDASDAAAADEADDADDEHEEDEERDDRREAVSDLPAPAQAAFERFCDRKPDHQRCATSSEISVESNVSEQDEHEDDADNGDNEDDRDPERAEPRELPAPAGAALERFCERKPDHRRCEDERPDRAAVEVRFDDDDHNDEEDDEDDDDDDDRRRGHERGRGRD